MTRSNVAFDHEIACTCGWFGDEDDAREEEQEIIDGEWTAMKVIYRCPFCLREIVR